MIKLTAIMLIIVISGISYAEELIENVNYDDIIGKLQTTKDQREKIEEVLNEIKDVRTRLIGLYQEKLDAQAKVLFNDYIDKWMSLAKARSEIIADRYRGGTLSGVVYGKELIKMHQKMVIELKIFQHEYFDP